MFDLQNMADFHIFLYILLIANQIMSDTLKKGTKFRLLFGGGETQITHVISLKRNNKVPFSTKKVFLTNIEKRHHYLVRYQ